MSTSAARVDTPSTTVAAPARGRWRTATVVAAASWGLLHVVGGLSLLIADGRGALESLAPDASEGAIPADPGPVVEAVLRFHAFDILCGGVVVAVLALTLVRTAWPRGVAAVLGIELVLDAGLVVFLVLPGHTPLIEAMWGPSLLAVAVFGAWRGGWRPGLGRGPGALDRRSG